jgi:hypothetical protein
MAVQSLPRHLAQRIRQQRERVDETATNIIQPRDRAAAQRARRQRERENRPASSATRRRDRPSGQRLRRQRERDNRISQHPAADAGPPIQRVLPVPFALQPLPPENSIATPVRHILSAFTVTCASCNALHFIEERLTKSSITNPQFSSCCRQHGNVLPLLEEPPEPLYSLLHDETEREYPGIK